MHWLLAGYMWLFIHRPFEVWASVLGAWHLERIYMIVTIVAWAIMADKSWIRNRVNVALAGLVGAILVSYALSPYRDAGEWPVMETLRVGVFYLLLMSCIHDERRLKFIITAYVTAVGLYLAHSLWEYGHGRHVWRMGTQRMIGVDATMSDPNSFAGTLMYALPMVWPLWHELRGWRKGLLMAFTGALIVSVLLTGSRTGLLGLAVLGGTLLVVSSRRVVWGLAFAAVVPMLWIMLPEDRQMRFKTMLDPTVGPANAQESAQSRVDYFWRSVDLWQDRIATGYGPGAFPVASHTKMQAHTLYGQLMAETGLIGIIAFAGLLAAFVLNARDFRRLDRGIPWRQREFTSQLSLAVMAGVLVLLVMGIGGHNLFRNNWMWFAAFQAIALTCRRRSESDWEAYQAATWDEEWNDGLASGAAPDIVADVRAASVLGTGASLRDGTV